MPDELQACGYPRHRHTDWHLDGSARVECGICHPPADTVAAVYVHGGQPVEPGDRASAHVVTGLAR